MSPYADLFHANMHEALDVTARRLRGELGGVFNLETIERYLHESFAELESRATVSRFTPLIAEKQARQRLRAIASTPARVVDQPLVLFVCTHNAGRSQMAQGFFRAYAGDKALAWSGGSHPSETLNGLAVQAMREVGVDITHDVPRRWTDESVRASDVVVTLGRGEACPIFDRHHYEDWSFAEPSMRSLDDVRVVRDRIRECVERLVGDLHLAA